jgi:gliding motility-associated-like protein
MSIKKAYTYLFSMTNPIHKHSPRKLVLAMTLCGALFVTLEAQQTIADGLPGCLDATITQVGISCGGGATSFGLSGGSFVVNNVDGVNCCGCGTLNGGGDFNSYFEIGPIDISSFTNISIFMSYSAATTDYEDNGGGPYFGCTGDCFIDNGHDQIVFQYSINGGPFVQSAYIHGTTAGDFTGVWNPTGLNGNTITIRVYASNKAGAEEFIFSNLLVQGTPLTINAGMDQSVCEDQAANLNGSGAGMWTGGSGIFGNPSTPITTYTPGLSDVGNTITLTYAGNPGTSDCGNSYPAPSDDMLLTVIAAPDINPVMSTTQCNSYTLPPITGSNLTTGAAYYTGMNGSGMSFNPGQDITTTTTLFIYDSTAPGCSDEETFTVTITTEPELDPVTDVTACGSYTLPAISGNNLTGTQAYYTSANGTGTSFAPGDMITSSTTLFIYDSAGPSCDDETSFSITITPAPDVTPQNAVTACNSYTLPPISGSNLTGTQAYYSGSNGTGMSFSPGDVINASTSLFIYDSSGPGCSDEETLSITITAAPSINPAAPVAECGSYVLPAISGSNLTGTQAYYTGANGSSTSFAPGDMITSSISLFIYDSAGPGCSDEQTFNITITPEPDIDMQAPVSQCNSYTLPAITGTNLTGGQSYFSGPNGSGTPFSPGQTINSSTSLFIYDSAAPGCSDEESLNITITPAPDIDMQAPVSQCGSYTLTAITGTNLTGGQSYFSGPNGSGTPFSPGQTINSSTSLFIYDSAAPGCSDEEMLNITITPEPAIDMQAPVSQCGSYTLPAITGSNLTGGQSYFSGPNGTGTPFSPGQTINSSTSLFIYDSAGPGCSDEQTLNITITPEPDINMQAPVSQCGSYTLPAITGTNLTGGQSYFSGPNGSGTPFSPGQTINSSTSLFIYDSAGAGCSDEEMLNITITPAPIIDPITDVNECGNYTLPAITGSNLTGTQAYYTGPNGGGTVFFAGETVSNSQFLYAFDNAGAGCTDEASFSIFISPEPDVFPISDVTTCDKYVLPAINGINFSGQPAYYTSPGGTGITYQEGDLIGIDLQLFAYSGTAGCEDEESFFITVAGQPVLDPLSDTTVCGGFVLPAITGSNLSGNQAYYTASGGGGTSLNAGEEVMASGTYYAYDGTSGCEDETAFVVTVLNNIDISCSVIADESSPGADDGIAEISIDMPTTAPYTISWTGPESGSITNSMLVNQITGLSTGTYTFTVSGSDGCSDNCTLFIDAPTCSLNTTIASFPTSCANSNNGAINVNVIGGTGFILFDWNVNALDGMASPSGLSPGNYSVTIVDELGCSSVETAVVAPGSASVEIACSVTSAASGPAAMDGVAEVEILSGSAPFTIDYSGPSVGSQAGVLGINILNNLLPGDYSITVIDDNGCAAFCSFTITDCGLAVNFTIVEPFCENESNGSIDVLASGGTAPFTYDWDNDAFDGMSTINGLDTGLYQLTVTDANNCTVENSIALALLNPLQVSCFVVIPNSAPMAAEGAADIAVNGGTAPYILDIDGPVDFNFIETAPGIVSLTNLPGGYYFTTLTDANGCISECGFYIETMPCNMTADFTIPGPLCAGDTGQIQIALMDAIGPVVFDWSIDSLDGIQNPGGLLPGSYQVAIVDSIGCVVDTELEILESRLRILCTVTNGESTVGASDGEAMVNFQGDFPPFEITWSGPVPGSQTIGASGSINLTGLSYGSYEVVVKDDNGCTETCTFFINSPNCGITLDSIVTDASCETSNDGAIDLIISGGAPAFAYFWSNDSTTQDLNNIGPGLYEVKIVDAFGCDISAVFDIEALNPDPEVVITGPSTICEGSCAEFDLQFTGTPPYTLEFRVRNSTYDQSFTFNTSTNSGLLEICPDDLGLTEDVFQVSFPTLNDAVCQSMPGDLFSIDILPVARDTINDTLCQGESILVNGTIYDQSNTNGTETILDAAPNGCDSIIVIDLTFLPVDTFDLMQTLCPGESVIINGTTYDETMPTGIEVLENASANGCDSILNVRISFFPIDTASLMTTLCPGESLTFNGTVYNEANPTGTEVLADAGANGCDSIVNVMIAFFPIDTFNFNTTLCPGENIVFNGTTYDEANPTGVEILPGADVNGCDSIINVAIEFFPIDTFDFTVDLCPGESIIFNGTTYDETNTSGIEILPGADANGCDSIVSVMVSILPIDTVFINQQLCTGDSLVVNETTYNETNPSGLEVIPNGDVNGCDSVISVMLTFGNAAINDITETLCPGESLTVNGMLYDELTPTGSDTIPNGSVSGCDSIINVMLNFYELDTTDVTFELCQGDSVVINGTTYNEAMPNGTEVLTGANVNGCDSILNVLLLFIESDTAIFTPELCPGDSIVFNGTTYNEAMPQGIETLEGAAANGCDSIVNIMLTFLPPPDTMDLVIEICPGDSLIFNGTTYNEAMPQGIETLEGAAANGCDSIVNVMITFSAIDTAILANTLCPGDSLVFNGTTYNEAMPQGIEVLEGAAANGCDSIVNVMLSFFPADTNFINQQLCTGDSLVVNETTYNETNPAGIEIIPNGDINGCDSIISVMLTFGDAAVNDINEFLCPGDSLVVNGTTYNESMPMGSDTIPNGSVAGCDSIINVVVTYLEIDTAFFTPEICQGDSIVINGTTYNESMPAGTEILAGAAANGCDSIITIMVTVLPPPDTTFLTSSLCTGDSLLINGTTYNEVNPNGIETIIGGSVNGCDSIISVMLTFGDASVNDIVQTLCPGDSLVVNGTTYNEAMPMGSDTIPNGSVAGCDSIINVMLSFFPADTNFINQQLCTGDSIIVNGTTYNAANPNGIETIVGGSTNGCDSTISVMLTFGDASVNDIVQSLCPGDSLVVNGTTYNEAMPMGSDTIPNGSVAGCDSIINVMLSFFPADTNFINQQLCTGDSIIVNGTTYNAANPNGIETIVGGSANGCDSTISVMLTFGDASVNDIVQTLCPGDSLMVNGTTYNEAMPMGSDTIPNGSVAGCDSIINVMLSFFPADTNFISQQLCTGDSIIVNGTTYNAANPNGIETIVGGSTNGCDSTISVMLTFGDASVNDIVQSLCPGDSLVVNGTTYNEAMPMGSDTIPNGSVAGCDSIINVMLSFFPADTNFISQQLCTGDSIIVNGTTYNAANPNGIENIVGGSTSGCDSTISVMLTFGDASVNDIVQTLCPGDSLVVNGTTYNEAMPMGSDTIPNGSVAGCDSIINVMLSFFPADTNFINQQLCTGDSIIVNGTTYNAANPNGIETIIGGSTNGCDSTISVMLTFGDASVNDIVQTLCPGDSLVVNGTTYNEAMPMGSDTIPNGSVAGCDSIINVMLSFFPADTNFINQQLCTGDSIIVNGTTYNAANPNGIETIIGGSASGCDSTISVMLTFGDASVNDIVQSLCPGDSLVVNGTTYNEAMPMGSDTIPNGSVAGCDSIINVMLSFFPADTNFISQQLCTGDSIIVNGTTYNAANPNGIETIIGGTANGCDSTISVMLTFGDASVNDIVQTLCPGDSLVVNGTTYNGAMPMGSDTIPNGSVAGCDSIINVMLSFFPADTNFISQQLCTGDSVIVNGTTYNAANPNGIETIIGGSASGCDSTISVMLLFDPVAIENITDTLCTGGSLVVNGTVYDEAMPSGQEIIEAGSANGCDSIINVNLFFIEEVTGFLEGNATICAGDSTPISIQLSNDILDVFNVVVSDGLGNLDMFENIMSGFTFFVDPQQTTTYTIEAIGVSGSNCPLSIGQPVTITVASEQVDAQLISDYNGFGVSCAESEDGSVGVLNMMDASYLWSNGSTDSILTDLGPGTYFVTVSTPAGCTAVDSVIVTAPAPIVAKASGIAANCLDSLSGNLLIESLLGGTPPYEYSLDGAFFQSIPDGLPVSIPGVAPGSYNLIIQDVNDCQVTTTISVGAAEILELELGTDKEIRLGDSVLLQPQVFFELDSFLWTPPLGLNTPFDLNPFASPPETTTYQLTAFDSLGCVVSDQITIFVNTQGSVYVPNIFSPNDDGRNDFFTIFTGPEVEVILEFQIFDRWGNQVFEGGPMQPNNESLGWDGTFNGEPMDPAVFVFYAELQYADGRTEIVKGDVVLIR